MIETDIDEKVCPSCKSGFYPEEGAVYKTFCGEDDLCKPPEAGYKDDECRTYHFCSEKCAEGFEKNTPTCNYVPGWKKLMVKIDKVSSSSGVKGARPHQLRQNCR
jgi:hypothetical protein